MKVLCGNIINLSLSVPKRRIDHSINSSVLQKLAVSLLSLIARTGIFFESLIIIDSAVSLLSLMLCDVCPSHTSHILHYSSCSSIRLAITNGFCSGLMSQVGRSSHPKSSDRTRNSYVKSAWALCIASILNHKKIYECTTSRKNALAFLLFLYYSYQMYFLSSSICT